MRTVLLTTTLVLGLAVSGCTADDSQRRGSAAPSTGASDTSASGTSASEEPPAPRTDGPLQLDDSRGKACASLRYGREYTAWEHVLRPEQDVRLVGFRLVGAQHVRTSRPGFVAGLPRKVPATGFTLGFPPGPDVVGSRNIDWDGRRPAVGAVLEAGSASNFWVRIQVDEGVRRAQYEGLELRYTAGGQEYTALSDIRTRFRWRCA